MRFRPRHVRSRLTLWYAGVLAGVLTLYAGVALSFLLLSLNRELDANLHAEYEEAEDQLHVDEAGGVRLCWGGENELRGLVEVWSTDGRLLYRSERLGGDSLGPSPLPSALLRWPSSLTLRDGTPLRMREGLRHVRGRKVVLRVAISRTGLIHTWHKMAAGLLLGLPIAVA